jgi:uncharacterized protein (TIGR04255 family)
MKKPWKSLPKFENPPVAETVLAVKFRTISQLDSVRMIEFWTKCLRDDATLSLPVAETRPPYIMPIERFEVGPNQLPGNLLQMVNLNQGPLPTRYWFSSEDGESLVQLQQDWIAFNWRKQPTTRYERFENGMSKFEHIWTKLTAYLDEMDMGPLVPVQSEVTYINNIPPNIGSLMALEDGPKVTKLLAEVDGMLPGQEAVALSAQYLAKDDEDQPFARLYVQFNSAFRQGTLEPLFVLNLTFRGRPVSEDFAGIRDFFECGHNWIVGGFDELTTEKMHEEWIRGDRGENE